MTEHNPPRYDVVDYEGKPFISGGFSMAKKISAEQGAWLLANAENMSSLWFWLEHVKT